jgi:hypothetical protein
LIKKTVIGILIFGLIAVIGFFVFVANFDIFESPKVSILKTECDYKGLRRVILSRTNGNAVTNSSIEITVTKCDSINSENIETIFIADSPNLKENDVKFKWKNLDTLTIVHNQNLKIFRQMNVSESVNPKIIFEYVTE